MSVNDEFARRIEVLRAEEMPGVQETFPVTGDAQPVMVLGTHGRPLTLRELIYGEGALPPESGSPLPVNNTSSGWEYE
jgi:hypothetical protein